MPGGSGRILSLIGIGLAVIALSFGSAIRTNHRRITEPQKNFVAVRPIDSKEEYYTLKIQEALLADGKKDNIGDIQRLHSKGTSVDILKIGLHMEDSDFNLKYPRESILRDVRTILNAMKDEVDIPIIRVRAYMPTADGKKDSLASDLTIPIGDQSATDWSKTTSAEIMEACGKVWFRDDVY